MKILYAFFLVIGGAVIAPAFGQEANGISSSAISRCAGRIGFETRQADPAFGFVALDGMPWVTIERTEEKIGNQQIATTVSGTGMRQRRDGSSVPFRFTCMINDAGEAVMFHTSHLLPRLGDQLPPSIAISGSATFGEKTPAPRGVELQVQLLDLAKGAPGEILSEQVVRTGWSVPIPFTLRLPKDISLQGRKLVIAAQLVLGRQVLFKLAEPHAFAAADVGKWLDLTLRRADPPRNVPQ
ncbi:MAG: YbaY family lipoprotein [Reyranellaceae bacterium]